MSLLDDVDSFRSYEFDISDGLNPVYPLTKSSFQQYSSTQNWLPEQIFAQYEQLLAPEKEEQDGVNNKQNVQTSISEDLAGGQSAKLDASLKLLSEDELGDNNIHIIETARHSGNHALQDYQMQLMLLEQQNKKRLLLAKQEQEGKHTPFKKVATTREFKRLFEMSATKKERAQAAVTQKRSRDLRATQFPPKMLPTGASISPVTTTKRQKRRHEPQTLLSEVDNIEITGLPPHFDLLYRVSCNNEDHSGRHSVPAFCDVPKVQSHSKSYSTHLYFNGSVPVLDLEAFMANDTDNSAFVVIRTVKCSEASVLMAQAGGPFRWTESIYTKSKISKNAMQQIATCYFQPVDIETPFEQNEITPADLFFFHHRHLLKSYALERSESKNTLTLSSNTWIIGLVRSSQKLMGSSHVVWSTKHIF
ncbi:hypothetical protein MMC14_009002 [Varicellaria rhodocarpa]|nr:hypothetical protein [Varicellaria rhodocarpa]